jgi:putative aldouronate transport system substrate-binding protein
MTKEQLAAGVVRQTQTKADKFNVFQGANSEAMQSKGALLNKLESEAYLKIIYGEKPLEYFDEFVKEWKTNGGDQVTEDVNKWYQSLKSK